MSDQYELQNTIIVGTISIGEDEVDEGKQLLNDLSEAEVPSELGNNVKNITDDLDGSVVIYSNKFPTNQTEQFPAGEVNLFSASTDQDGDIQITADIDSHLFDDFADLFSIVLSHSNLHITDFDMGYELDTTLEDINISVDGPDVFEFYGVRFSDNGISYIVQSEDYPEIEDSDGEEGNNNIHLSVSTLSHFDVESADFMKNKRETVEETIQEILK